MIPARHSHWGGPLVRSLIARGLRKTFFAFYADGLEHVGKLDPARPVVGCCNHTNWWDGFALQYFTKQRLGRDFHLAMEEKNLRRYLFFTWVGVFGVDLELKAGAVGGLRYGARLLQERADRVAWIFVQGKLSPPGEPVTAKPGASFFARQSKAQILPTVLRYEWLAESRPSLFLRCGAPLESSATPEEIAIALNALAAGLDADIAARGRQGFAEVIAPKMSLNKRWDLFVHRLRGGKRETFRGENG